MEHPGRWYPNIPDSWNEPESQKSRLDLCLRLRWIFEVWWFAVQFVDWLRSENPQNSWRVDKCVAVLRQLLSILTQSQIKDFMIIFEPKWREVNFPADSVEDLLEDLNQNGIETDPRYVVEYSMTDIFMERLNDKEILESNYRIDIFKASDRIIIQNNGCRINGFKELWMI